jgi:phospholipase/lecithinase/hemolysin
MKRIATFLTAFAFLFSMASASFAGQVTQMVVFGDSLSDTGNTYIATSGLLPGPPAYATGLFTDGPNSAPATTGPVGVWDQQLATLLNVSSPTPYLAGTGGANFAFGSAQTGNDPNFPNNNGVPYIGDQVNVYLSTQSSSLSSSTLYTFWGGANDILNGVSPQTAVDNLVQNIDTLAADGGKYFMWLNLPPLGDTPFGLASGESTTLNALSGLFDSEWAAAMQQIEMQFPSITLVGVDVNSLFNSILADPAAYGFANINSPAQGLNVDPNTYLFWDGLHPTTEGHMQVADLAYTDFERAVTPTPEPTTFVLTFLGIIGLLAASRIMPRQKSASSSEAFL